MQPISFARGVPAAECLPVAELADCAHAALEHDGDGRKDVRVPIRNMHILIDEMEKVGEGTHERFVIDAARFLERLGAKTRG